MIRSTEHFEQCELIRWKTKNIDKCPELKMMFAIPNGGKRHIVTGKRLKAEGVMPGVPDIFLAVPKGRFHGLFIEMKREAGGHTSDDQYNWIMALSERGYATAICRGSAAAIDCISQYLSVSI